MVDFAPLHKIKTLTLLLLEDGITVESASSVIKSLHQILADHADFSGSDHHQEAIMEVQLAAGYAIRPNEAAACLFDVERTINFLKGVYLAIEDWLQWTPDQPIRILYAGCGPYALFCTLLGSIYTPSQITFTLIEVNQKSYSSASTLINSLGIQHYIEEFILTDAIKYVIPSNRDFQILLSETMDKALLKEALVPILHNLKPQLSPKTTIIPENVTVRARLYPQVITGSGTSPQLDDLEKVDSQNLGVVFDLREYLRKNQNGEFYSTGPIHVSDMSNYRLVVYSTHITIYKDITLEEEHANITKSIIHQFNPDKISDNLIFTYPLSQVLGLKFEVV